MSVHQPGTPVNLIARFVTIDPLTEADTPADPTTVTFTIVDPAGVETAYVSGVDLNVTHPAVGVFVCLLSPPLEPGDYQWRAAGAGAVVGAVEGTFTILQSGVSPTVGREPTAGPCSPWITGADVAEAPGVNVGSDAFRLDDWASLASDLLFALSGRQYPGVCEQKVRPCSDGCGCWDDVYGAGPWYWSLSAWGYGGPGGCWVDDRGDRCGCTPLSIVRLPGYPVQEILEVKIDGAVLASSGYRVDYNQDLVRLDDPGPPVVQQRWPGCQNLTLTDTEAGTFSVTYRYGMEPPAAGRLAASQLAADLYLGFTGAECKLPAKVTRVVRQGVTYERTTALAEMLRTGATGLPLVDAFLATANPNRLTRRPMIYSPDVQPFARPL